MSPGADLQAAIFGALHADAGLASLVGERIVDHAPANLAFPYVSFGRTSLFDWSTGTESGTEQIFTLHAWSRGKGKKEILEIMNRLRAALHDAALDLGSHRLVNLRLENSEARYDDRSEAYQGLMRFRAVMEEGG